MSAKYTMIEGFKVNIATGKPLGRPPMEGTKRRKIYDSIIAKAAQTTGPDKHSAKIIENIPDPVLEMTDGQIIKTVKDRFLVYETVIKAVCEGIIRSVVVSGVGGVGKSFTTEQIVNYYRDKEGVKVSTISGVVTPISLYRALWENREMGSVLVMDDADGVFFNDDSLSLLKAAMDMKDSRWVSWLSESNVLKSEGIEKKFLFEGTIIFLTNIDFEDECNRGSKRADHLQALMNRATYVDLMLHSNRVVGLWVDFMVQTHKILEVQEHLSAKQQTKVLEFMAENRDSFRDLSIRTARKIASYMRSNPDMWELMARSTEFSKTASIS